MTERLLLRNKLDCTVLSDRRDSMSDSVIIVLVVFCILVSFLVSSGFLCSFLFPPEAHERKERSANLPTALRCLFFLNGCPSRPYFGVRGESPIDFLIGKCAVNVPSHHHSATLNDFLPCVLSALGNHLKNSLEDVLRPYSVNFLLHILKIQPLIICIPLALHWITCGG